MRRILTTYISYFQLVHMPTPLCISVSVSLAHAHTLFSQLRSYRTLGASQPARFCRVFTSSLSSLFVLSDRPQELRASERAVEVCSPLSHTTPHHVTLIAFVSLWGQLNGHGSF